MSTACMHFLCIWTMLSSLQAAPCGPPEKTNQTGRASLPFTVLHFAAPLQMDPRTLSFCISEVCLFASLQRMIILRCL